MSKTYLAAYRQTRKSKDMAEKALHRASSIGSDPRNSVNTAAALCGRVMPKWKIVDGRRVWDV
jgi:hypothetical protein